MDLSQVFDLHISKDRLRAKIDLKEETYNLIEDDDEVTTEAVIQFINDHNVNYGILYDQVKKLSDQLDEISFPVIVAEGKEPIHGKDGWVEYHVDLQVTMELDEQEDIDYKEVVKIPKVEAGQLLATLISPTSGEQGFNVLGEAIMPKPGKYPNIKAGSNTQYVEDDQSFYATENGQVSVGVKDINVLPVYEVSNTLDLNTGNIDFNGSIVIKGDVPEGFTVKARGDISVYGLVEAAYLEAGGSVFVREGISGLGKGTIKAGVDIHIKNVNQGILMAGRNVIVNQSIFHSQVEAKEQIHCQRGHIIGGSASAGKKVACRDVGNRMNTKTLIYLGENQTIRNQRIQLEKEIHDQKEQIQKLEQIGSQLQIIEQKKGLSDKEQQLLDKQKHSLAQAKLTLQELNHNFQQIQSEEPQEDFIKLSANGIIYPNTEVIVGKYVKNFKKEEKYISVVYKEHDFYISSL